MLTFLERRNIYMFTYKCHLTKNFMKITGIFINETKIQGAQGLQRRQCPRGSGGFDAGRQPLVVAWDGWLEIYSNMANFSAVTDRTDRNAE